VTLKWRPQLKERIFWCRRSETSIRLRSVPCEKKLPLQTNYYAQTAISFERIVVSADK
jgi:hypothetical protein